MTTASSPKKHIILYADDDRDDRELISEALLAYAENVEVVTCEDGKEAVDCLDDLREHGVAPCLIILDINMPRMDGLQTLKEIKQREEFSAIPVVVFTTSSMPRDMAAAEQLGAAFMSKPIHQKQMAAIADAFIEHCSGEIKEAIRKK